MTGGHAVVVGAGISGLASAALLAQEGYRVTVVEARAEVGGRAGRWDRDGFRFDTGPSWYLMPEVFDHFFRLLGTTAAEQLDLVRLEPGYRVFFEHHPPMDVAADRAANIATFERLERGAGARLADYLDSAAETYAMATRHFLYTSYASLLPLAHRDVLTGLPRLARLLTESLEDRVAREFGDTRLRQVLGYPAVFLGSSPGLTPSMYHLMSHLDLADGVLYPLGGFTRLIEAVRVLAEERGVQILTGTPVERITTRRRLGPRGRRATATGVIHRSPDGRRHHLAADVVVSTVDLHQTETRLLPPRLRSRSPRWWDTRVPGPSAVLVLLGVRGALPELRHHSLLFADSWQGSFDRIFPPRPRRRRPRSGPGAADGGVAEEAADAGAGPGEAADAGAAADPTAAFPDPTSLYVCRPSATDPTVAPPGHENLFVLVPVPPDPDLGRGGVDGHGDPWVEGVADAALAQVARWAGIPDLADRVVVRRTIGPGDFAEDLRTWRGTALGPAHTLAQSAMFRAGNASRRVGGLFHAGGSVIPGIGLPMCLISAEILIKRLRGDTSTGPLPVPGDSLPVTR